MEAIELIQTSRMSDMKTMIREGDIIHALLDVLLLLPLKVLRCCRL